MNLDDSEYFSIYRHRRHQYTPSTPPIVSTVSHSSPSAKLSPPSLPPISSSLSSITIATKASSAVFNDLINTIEGTTPTPPQPPPSSSFSSTLTVRKTTSCSESIFELSSPTTLSSPLSSSFSFSFTSLSLSSLSSCSINSRSFRSPSSSSFEISSIFEEKNCSNRSFEIRCCCSRCCSPSSRPSSYSSPSPSSLISSIAIANVDESFSICTNETSNYEERIHSTSSICSSRETLRFDHSYSESSFDDQINDNVDKDDGSKTENNFGPDPIDRDDYEVDLTIEKKCFETIIEKKGEKNDEIEFISMSDSKEIESETITNVPVPTSQETVALSISTTPISAGQCERKNFHHRRPTMHLISESIGLSIHNRFANNNQWYSVVDSLRNSDENRMDRNFYDIDAMDRNNLYRYDYDHNHNNYDDDDDDEKKRIRQKSSRNYCNDYDEVDADDWGGEEDLPYGGDGNQTVSTKAEQLRRSEFDDFRSVANNFESENLQPNCSKQNLQPSSELSTNVFPKQSTNRDRCELRSISFASPSTMLTVTKPSQSSVMVTSMKSSSTMAQSTMMIHQRSYDGRKTIATRQNESNNNSASVVSKSSAEIILDRSDTITNYHHQHHHNLTEMERTATFTSSATARRESDLMRFIRSPNFNAFRQSKRYQMHRVSLLGRPIHYRQHRQITNPRYKQLQNDLHNFLERPRGCSPMLYHVIM